MADRLLAKFQKQHESLTKKLTSLLSKPVDTNGNAAAVAKRQETRDKEVVTLETEIERTLLQIKSIECGVQEIVDNKILADAYQLLDIDEEFREFWLAFHREPIPMDESCVNMRFRPPSRFGSKRSDPNIFNVIFAVTVCHEADVFASLLSKVYNKLETNHWYTQETGRGNTPIHIAIDLSETSVKKYKSYEAMAVTMLGDKKVPMEILTLENKDGMTPMRLASRNDSLKIVKALRKRGVNADAEAVRLAFQYASTSVAKLLLDNISSVVDEDTLKDLRWQLVHILVSCAANEDFEYSVFCELLELLLAFGSDINCCNSRGETLLHVAAMSQSVDPICIELMKRGADPSKEDAHGKLPYDYITHQDQDALRDIFKFHSVWIRGDL